MSGFGLSGAPQRPRSLGGDVVKAIYDRNHEATVYVGGLEEQVTEKILAELFMQVGKVHNVNIPRDRVNSKHQGFGFVEFKTETDADYAITILSMTKLNGRPIRVNKASQNKREVQVGANLFIGGLSKEVDDRLLTDAFAAFGNIITCKVMFDPETADHRGFGFVTYDTFEASDAAKIAMDKQYLAGEPLSVSYAYKKDTQGERHGSEAERLLSQRRMEIWGDKPKQ